METLDKSNIREVLSEAVKFSGVIDKYVRLLGLNQNVITTFKNDVLLLRVIVENSSSFSEGFVSYNTITIQWRLTALVVKCTGSKNFTNEIGEDLGIKIPLNDTQGLSPLMKLNWGIDVTDNETFSH